ncbi:YwqG family protein [Spirillospora sp. CA-253888]
MMPNMPFLEERLRRAAHRQLPSAVAEQWISLIRPAVRLRHRTKGRRLVGQLGGLPSLPPQVPWPVWEDRGSLNFVAALDCAHLPAASLDLAVPQAGSLLFFYLDPEDGLFDPDYPPDMVTGEPATLAGAQVLYVPPDAVTVERQAPFDVDPYERVELTAQLMATGPDFSHPELRAATRNLPAWEQRFMDEPGSGYGLRDELAACLPPPRHWLGGHALPVQDAVEMEVAYTHLSGRVPWQDPALQQEGCGWRLLAQFDSDDLAGMRWGDIGTLYWLIRPHDLAAHRFGAASFTWQCT